MFEDQKTVIFQMDSIASEDGIRHDIFLPTHVFLLICLYAVNVFSRRSHSSQGDVFRLPKVPSFHWIPLFSAYSRPPETLAHWKRIIILETGGSSLGKAGLEQRGKG